MGLLYSALHGTVTVAMYKVRLLSTDLSRRLYLKTELRRGARTSASRTCRAVQDRVVLDFSMETRFPVARLAEESVVMSIKKERGIGLRSEFLTLTMTPNCRRQTPEP